MRQGGESERDAIFFVDRWATTHGQRATASSSKTPRAGSEKGRGDDPLTLLCRNVRSSRNKMGDITGRKMVESRYK